jgi:hypothetical protein
MNKHPLHSQFGALLLMCVSAFTALILWGADIKTLVFANILSLTYCLLYDDEQGA